MYWFVFRSAGVSCTHPMIITSLDVILSLLTDITTLDLLECLDLCSSSSSVCGRSRGACDMIPLFFFGCVYLSCTFFFVSCVWH